MTSRESWEQHSHEGLVHEHDHVHVTHNWNAETGSFEHLTSAHTHQHNHAPLTHAHHPHRNFEEEHVGEAHVHDHETPTG